jgi:glycosyltransferase involved in cell wall biosynthesis
MRILHVSDGYRPRLGGIEVFVEDLARRQAAAGHDVSVLTASRDATGSVGDDEGPVRVIRTPLTLRHPVGGPRARAALLDGYDVVHAHLSVVSPYTTALSRLADESGLATVNTVHSMWASRRSMVRAVRAIADWDRSRAAWTAVSRAAAADVRDVLAPGTPIHVVPNAVDVGWWREGVRWPEVGGPVTLVSVMRIAGRKRPFALLAMLEAVRAQVPAHVDLRALVVGDGPHARRMQVEIERGPLGGWVSLLGRRSREEIRDLYADADLYVAPAYEESFGIAALEARAAGLPVVAMRSGGVGEFVEHEREGLLCEDDAAMTAALVRLCTVAGDRRSMAAYNVAHPPRQDWPNVLTDFESVYRWAGAGQGLGWFTGR